jgi:hypothetical protein
MVQATYAQVLPRRRVPLAEADEQQQERHLGQHRRRMSGPHHPNVRVARQHLCDFIMMSS